MAQRTNDDDNQTTTKDDCGLQTSALQKEMATLSPVPVPLHEEMNGLTKIVDDVLTPHGCTFVNDNYNVPTATTVFADALTSLAKSSRNRQTTRIGKENDSTVVATLSNAGLSEKNHSHESGLRHFSKCVLLKVQEKQVTSFAEVADEISREMNKRATTVNGNQHCANKNIRRRVYDVLNVLVAMNIITKDNKMIMWIGLPSNTSEEQQHLEEEKRQAQDSLQQKKAELQDLILQQIAYKNLLLRNSMHKNQVVSQPEDAVIHLPFIVVRTSERTVIDHNVSDDDLNHRFTFDQPFEIHDDIDVLKRMGMVFGLEKNTCTEENLELSKTMVSKALEPYVEEMAKRVCLS